MCSKCALGAPSPVRTVQPSWSIVTSPVPPLIIGSMQIVMPASSFLPEAAAADVRHVRGLVQSLADAVPDEVPDDAVACPFAHPLHGRADVADPVPRDCFSTPAYIDALVTSSRRWTAGDTSPTGNVYAKSPK